MADVIAEQFKMRKDDLLEVIYWNKMARPSIFNSLSFRMSIPLLFNNIVNRVFSSDVIKTLENQGLTYDWISQDRNISLKSVKEEIFARLKKLGKGMTKPTPIQLKNTKDTRQFFCGEFDHLIITMENPVSFALLDCKRVMKLLSNSHLYNEHCDKNGFDGKGQVLLFVPSKKDCLFYAQINKNLEEKFAKKYRPSDPDELNMIVHNWNNQLLNLLADKAKAK